MYREHTRALMTAALSLALLGSACQDDTNPGNGGETENNVVEQNNDNNVTENNGNNVVEPEFKLLASQRPRVKFKGGDRWSRDLSRSLALEQDELCRELGQYDCVKLVHKIALGGVEPYSLGIDKPVDTAPVTAPLATDRVALSACDLRAERDLASAADAVIFKEMPADGAPSAEQLEAMSTRLVERVFNRDAREAEVSELSAFWEEVAADSQDPRRDWATLACFSLATSVESLFY